MSRNKTSPLPKYSFLSFLLFCSSLFFSPPFSFCCPLLLYSYMFAGWLVSSNTVWRKSHHSLAEPFPWDWTTTSFVPMYLPPSSRALFRITTYSSRHSFYFFSYILYVDHHWRERSNRRSFFIRFASDHDFDPFVADNWYNVKHLDICSYEVLIISLFFISFLHPRYPYQSFNFIQEGKMVLSFHGNNHIAAVMSLFPEVSFQQSSFTCIYSLLLSLYTAPPHLRSCSLISFFLLLLYRYTLAKVFLQKICKDESIWPSKSSKLVHRHRAWYREIQGIVFVPLLISSCFVLVLLCELN